MERNPNNFNSNSSHTDELREKRKRAREYIKNLLKADEEAQDRIAKRKSIAGLPSDEYLKRHKIYNLIDADSETTYPSVREGYYIDFVIFKIQERFTQSNNIVNIRTEMRKVNRYLTGNRKNERFLRNDIRVNNQIIYYTNNSNTRGSRLAFVKDIFYIPVS
ncbi:MAG: hypothetical protein ABH896_02655 [Candidatus Jacksonbacteria bacterium]